MLFENEDIFKLIEVFDLLKCLLFITVRIFVDNSQVCPPEFTYIIFCHNSVLPSLNRLQRVYLRSGLSMRIWDSLEPLPGSKE